MSTTTLEETFRIATENKVIPGAVLVATNKAGTLQYAQVFGKTGVSPDAKPLTLDSTFWIASCTKLMTTIACLQCVERGLFSLDSADDIARLLPEYSAPEILAGTDGEGKTTTVPAKNRITLRHLLTHTSGLSYEFLDPRLAAWRKTPEGSRAFDDEFLSKYVMPLVFEPGEKWTYGVGIDWAGKLVERANDGITLEAYMQQHIWDPLGIQDLTFHLELKEKVRQNLVEVSARIPESDLLVPAPNQFMPDPTTAESGGGGCYGSAPEYLKVLASILRDDGKLLKPESVAEMFKPHLSAATRGSWMEQLGVPAANAAFTGNLKAGTEFSWGLGGFFALEDLEDRRKKGSLAWGGLPNLFWWIDPEAGITGLYASQIVPTGEAKSTELFAEFEKDVYRKSKGL